MITDPTAPALHSPRNSSQSPPSRNSASVSTSADIAPTDRYESTSARSSRCASPACSDAYVRAASLSLAAPQHSGAQDPTTVAPSTSSIDSVQAALQDTALGKSVDQYKEYLQEAEVARRKLETLLDNDKLGGLTVKVGTLKAYSVTETYDVPPFELACDRLSLAEKAASSFGAALRILDQPQTRSYFVEKNGEEALQGSRTRAVNHLIRAVDAHHKLVDNIAMANCNEFLRHIVVLESEIELPIAADWHELEREWSHHDERWQACATRLRRFVMAEPEPSIAGWHTQREWPHFDEVLRACAPVTEQIETVAEYTYDGNGNVARAAWGDWLIERHRQLNESIADIAPMFKDERPEAPTLYGWI